MSTKYLKTKKPAVVFAQKKPQVAIIPSTKSLLDLAGVIPKGSGLPADLSKKHNEYTWD